MTPQELLIQHGIKLESYAPGRHYTTCPQCSHTRSAPHRRNKVLGVTIESDGKVCWGCNHCSWTGPEKGSGQDLRGSRELTTYLYRDRDGVVRFRKVRNRPGREPRFWLEQPDGNGWRKGTKGVDTKMILYRTDEVTKAITSGGVICCVEGEKDVDNLWRIGIAATCNAHGASDVGKAPKWTRVHSERLAGADLVVLNDNDAAGYAHADAICRCSLGVAQRVRRLDLAPHWPDMPKGADISDWLALGHTRAELEALIAVAPDWTPSAQTSGVGNGAAPVDDAVEIERLARMRPLDYERARKAAGERLGINRLSLLDSLVKAKRAELGLDGGDDKQGEAIEFPSPEPWPDPVDGADLLDEIAKAVRGHVVMIDHARDACALWVAHSYVTEHFAISPKLFARSAVKRCGKSTLFEVLSHLVVRPLLAVNMTPATAFRIIAKHRPTLLIDEVDSFLADNEELRGIINASHRHDGRVPRLVGEDFEPRNFRVYTAVALSGIGSLHPTLMDRAIIIDLKRRRASEKVIPLRIGKTGHLDDIARRIMRWIADNKERIAAMEPMISGAIDDRDADNWFALLAIADVAGGVWPQRARQAAEAMRIAAGDSEDWTELLLADIRAVFYPRAEPADRDEVDADEVSPEVEPIEAMSSAELIAALVEIPGHPWGEMPKTRKPLTQHQLAHRLKPLRIVTVKVGERPRVNGYRRQDFEEAFARYLPPLGDSDSDSRTHADEMGTSSDSRSDSLMQRSPSRKCEKPNNDGHESESPSRKGGDGDTRTARASEPCAERNPETASDPPELCARCGRPGGNPASFGEGMIRLHPDCVDPYFEERMAEGGIWSAS
jgi:hypothetical protein